MKKAFLKNKAKLISSIIAFSSITSIMSTNALAWNDEIKVDTTIYSANADALFPNILGILLGITRYIGIGLVIYGTFEIVQSFYNSQPELKSKGVMMTMSGFVCIGIKSMLIGAKILKS